MRPSPAYPESGLLARWARFAVRRRWLVVLAWIAALGIATGLWTAFRGDYASDFSLPGTETQQAFDLLKERFPRQAGDTARLVFKSDDGVAGPAVRPRIEAVLAQAAELPGAVSVSSPYARGGDAGVSADGRIAYATVQYAERATQMSPEDARKILRLVERESDEGLTVEAGGQVVEFNETAPPGASEMIGLAAAVIILLIAFGSVVAMGLPLGTAVVGIGASFALLGLSANVLDLPMFSPQFAGMIGLGVGIDYALLVVTRHREGLSGGLSVEDSVVRALTTAGRSVLFAGMAVAVAMLGMLAMGIPFVSGLGIAGAMVVGLGVLVALTLLPALLGFAGHTIDRWRIPMFHAVESGEETSLGYRLSAQIQRRPVLWFAASLGLLLLLAAPVLDMRLGFSDAGNASTRLHSRRAYDLLVEGFGPGFNGPLLVVVDLQAAGPAGMQRLGGLRESLASQPGVAFVSPPIPNQAGDGALITLVPTTAPQDEATVQLVHTLRRDTLPAALAGSGARAYLTGPVPAFTDIGDRITDRLAIFFGAVIGLSFLLLVLVFRSILVPLKAAIMNLLSIGAAYGVLVAIFQWGWLEGLLGVKPGPIETFLPMMLFAILFGLSMDYEVFLISRIREEYLRSRNNADAVARGLAVTARVITAAAAIMVAVFISFVLGPDRIIKEFGVGLATAIFVDATIVRLILVPATMELLGDANWWLPRWLDRLLPHLDVEGTRERETAGVAAD